MSNQGQPADGGQAGGAASGAPAQPFQLKPDGSVTRDFVNQFAPLVLGASDAPAGNAGGNAQGAPTPQGAAGAGSGDGASNLLMGRYDISTPAGLQQADAFMRQQQSLAAQAQNLLKRYQRYDPLIEEIEQDPRVAQGIIGVLQSAREGAGGAAPGSDAQAPPELVVKMEKDEYGQPTGATVDPASLAAYTNHIATAAANRVLSSALRTQQQKDQLRQGIDNFRRHRPEVSEEQVTSMLQLIKDAPPEKILELLYTGVGNQGAGGQAPIIAAEQRGQDMVFEQISRAQGLGPTLSSQGGGQPQRPNAATIMLQEMLAMDRADGGRKLLD